MVNESDPDGGATTPGQSRRAVTGPRFLPSGGRRMTFGTGNTPTIVPSGTATR